VSSGGPKQLKSILKSPGQPSTSGRRVSFPSSQAQLEMVRKFVSDPEEHMHDPASMDLENMEKQEGERMRRLEPVMAWQRPALLVLAENIVDVFRQRGIESTYWTDLHNREARELGEPYQSSALVRRKKIFFFLFFWCE